MQTIYEPKGRAREYAELALNLYRGCSHGCTYCFAPGSLHMTRFDFSKPQPRNNILAAIEAEAPKFHGKSVFLCFSTDPYQHIDEEHQLARKAIEILHANSVAVRILTKGGQRSTRDFDLLWKDDGSDDPRIDAYGATLTLLDDREHQFEPNAAPTYERIHALEEAHERGIYTWVSLEPVIDPKQTLQLITMTHEIVDEFKVGKWNHDSRANNIDWKTFVKQAVSLLEKYGNKYYIKRDLQEYR